MPKTLSDKGSSPLPNKWRSIDFTNRFIILGIFLAILLAMAFIDPAGSKHIPRCPFYALTGLKCPGCGSLRAVHAVLHGDFGKAWHFNALAVILLPLVLAGLIYNALRDRDPVAVLKLGWLGWFLTGAVILWWVFRNIFMW